MNNNDIKVASVRRKQAGNITANATITEDSPFFSGHFPGRPILPGLALVAMVERAMTAQPGAAIERLTGLRCVRFRKVIESSASFAIRVSPHEQHPDTNHRFEVICDGTRACDGVALTGGTPPEIPSADATGLIVEEPASDYIPHRGRMKLVDSLVEAGEGYGVCRATVTTGWPLGGPEGVSSTILTEVAAQSAAAMAGRERQQKHEEIGVAFLVGIKHACWSPAPIQVGTQLLIRVKTLLSRDGYKVFQAWVFSPDRHFAELMFQSFPAPSL